MEVTQIEKRTYNTIEIKQLFGLDSKQRISYMSLTNGTLRIEIEEIKQKWNTKN